MFRRIILIFLLATFVLPIITSCGNAVQPQVEQTAAEAKEATEAEAIVAPQAQADLSGVKTYLLEKANALKAHTARLKEIGHQYYELAKATQFDYARLWQEKPEEVTKIVEEARTTWMAASPGYEQIEGIIAGVPSLSEYDVILDAGAAGSEDPEGAVPFDLTLPDGRVLPKPGNLFGITESTLWGTYPDFIVPDIHADYNADGKQDFAELLPEANVFKASVDELDRYTTEMLQAAEAWQPTESDAFTALVTMVPTMSEYFDSWKNSRFVAGEAVTQRDFVAISRLADIQDILSSLQVTYAGVSPLVEVIDPKQAEQIEQSLADLRAFVADVHAQEKSGKHYTAEDADLLGAEAQNRATAITGQITQVAAQLDIELQN